MGDENPGKIYRRRFDGEIHLAALKTRLKRKGVLDGSNTPFAIHSIYKVCHHRLPVCLVRPYYC